jgi:aldose 1-epimerase
MRIVAAVAFVSCLTSLGSGRPSASALTLSSQAKRPPKTAGVTRAASSALVDGKPVDVFTLTNASGVQVKAISYGATITSWRAPDRNGQMADIVLGFDDPGQYVKSNPPYFGVVVGRYGNRIAKAQFTLDGQTYKLAANDGENSLHGGKKGFDKVLWTGTPTKTKEGPGVTFTYTSPDGEEGFPGTLKASVTYTLTDKNELIVSYLATTDKPTPINLTQHSYFNLAGQGTGDILGHELRINADRFTPVDATMIPTGELAPVENTPFDFRKATPIGARINSEHPQVQFGKGYDHNWVLARTGADLSLAAEAYEPKSGRTLRVMTTEPGVQFYTGNFLDGTITGKEGKVYKQRYGFCLETQHFPDSPNHPTFPSTILRPGSTYRSRTVFVTGTR